MKTTIYLVFLIVLSLFLLNIECQKFGYEYALVGKEVFCVRTIQSDFGYYIHKIEDLEVLQGEAEKYIPKPITPTPLPSYEL